MSGGKKDYYIITVEDQVIQITNYIVLADSEQQARQLVAKGVYAFESEREIVDTISSEIKTVEEVA